MDLVVTFSIAIHRMLDVPKFSMLMETINMEERGGFSVHRNYKATCIESRG